jgi:hypothetical protein
MFAQKTVRSPAMLVGILAALCGMSACSSPQKPVQNADDQPQELPTVLPPAPDPPEKSNDEPTSNIDKEHFKDQVTVAQRAAKNCATLHKSGPFGEVKMKIKILHTGRVGTIDMDPQFAEADIGKCIQNSFKPMMVPPWEGSDETVDVSVQLDKPDSNPPSKPTPDPKKKLRIILNGYLKLPA